MGRFASYLKCAVAAFLIAGPVSAQDDELEALFEGLKSEGLDTRRARALAGVIVTTGEGALVRARTSGSSKLVREAAKHLRKAIASSVD